jgi:hypothetical protein
MTMRVRKLIGTFLMLILITVYCLVMMVAAATTLPQISVGWHPVAYAIAGIAWLPPALWLISWMHKPDKPGAQSERR